MIRHTIHSFKEKKAHSHLNNILVNMHRSLTKLGLDFNNVLSNVKKNKTTIYTYKEGIALNEFKPYPCYILSSKLDIIELYISRLTERKINMSTMKIEDECVSFSSISGNDSYSKTFIERIQVLNQSIDDEIFNMIRILGYFKERVTNDKRISTLVMNAFL